MKRSQSINLSLPVAGDMLCSLLTLPTGLKWVYEGAGCMKPGMRHGDGLFFQQPAPVTHRRLHVRRFSR